MALALLLAVSLSFGLPPDAAQDSSHEYAVPLSGDRIALTIALPGGAEARVGVLNGGLVRVTPKGLATIGLLPVLAGTEVVLTVVVVTPRSGGEAVRQVGTITLTAGQPRLVAAAGVAFMVTLTDVRPPAPASPNLTGCIICCLTCNGVTVCGCEVVMDCGRCCCPDGCGCTPDDDRTREQRVVARR
jgi:hypothetical protein